MCYKYRHSQKQTREGNDRLKLKNVRRGGRNREKVRIRQASGSHARRLFCECSVLILSFHNFISVISFSDSSSVCTRLCLGVRVMRYGSGVRPDSPSYSSREMGSSGNDRISYAQSNREIASHSSRSATWIPGQMRRLRRQEMR
jgi:hypothetical protein